MDIRRFISDTYPSIIEGTDRYTTRYNQCSKILEKVLTYKMGEKYSKDELKPILSEANLVTQSTFFVYRQVARDIMVYLGYDSETIANLYQIQYNEVKSFERYDVEYFRDWNELSSALRTAFTEDKSIDLISLHGILALVWYGISLADIIQIQKSDIDEEQRTVKLPWKSRTYQISNDDAFNSIIRYRDRTGLTKSNYLCRTERLPQVTKSLVSRWIISLNDMSPLTGKVFKVKNITLSGSFDYAIKRRVIDGFVSVPTQYRFGKTAEVAWKVKYSEWENNYYQKKG